MHFYVCVGCIVVSFSLEILEENELFSLVVSVVVCLYFSGNSERLRHYNLHK